MQQLRVGQQLSQYRVEAYLGGGGMADVYLVEHLDLGVRRALKVLKRTRGELVPRLLREGRLQASLVHPNLVSVLEVIRIDGHPALVMDYVSGPTLDELLSAGPLPVDQADLLGRDILDGVIAAHARGVIHRDLKPSNILIDLRGARPVARVSDFGLAKALQGSDPDVNSTASGVVMGTPRFMAPEQFRDAKSVDERADVWSVGAVLYELVTGRPAFRADSLMSVMRQIDRAEFEPVVDVAPGTPPRMAKAIEAALVGDPDARCPTAVALRALWTEGSEAPPVSHWNLAALQREPRPLPPSGDSLLSDSTKELSAWGALEEEVARVRERETGEEATAPHSRMVVMVGVGLVTVAAAVLVAALVSQSLVADESGKGDATAAAAELGSAVSSRTTLLLSSSEPLSDPALSPDGKMLAYVVTAGGQADLWVRRVAGGSPVRLTDDDAVETDPDFSPDGERVAFSRRWPGAKAPEVAVVPSLGGDTRVLLPEADSPDWSPDGRDLAVIRKPPGEPLALTVAAADGSGVRDVLRADAAYPKLMSPAWSPDGQQLASIRSAGGIAGEVWVVPATGGAPQRLFTDPPSAFSRDPVYAPDGDRIVFQSNRNGAANLWSVRLDGTAFQQLTSGAGPDQSPSVAADGSVLFLNESARSVVQVHDAQTGEIREPHSHHWFLWAPSFSPDGRLVAFSQAEPDGGWDTWVVPAAGGEARRVAAGDTPTIYPRFSPDGVHLYSHSWGQPRTIWRVPVAGGPHEALTPNGAEESYADPSPDGRNLVFVRSVEGEPRLFVRPVPGGEARMVLDSPGTTPRWSPDGQWIAFSPDRIHYAGILVVRPDGSGLRRLTDVGSWPVWWPDSERVGYLAVAPNRAQEIRVVGLDGGPPERVDAFTFVDENRPFAISSDGRLMATTNVKHFSTDLWLLRPGG